MPLASMTTGAAATSRSARKYTAAATQKNTTPTKNTRRPSRPRSTLRMTQIYALGLYLDADATLDDLREAVTRLEETERTTRRVFGSAHPITSKIEQSLRDARAILAARETPPGSS